MEHVGYVIARDLGDGRMEWWEGRPDGTAALHGSTGEAASEQARFGASTVWRVYALVETGRDTVLAAPADQDPVDPRAGLRDLTGDWTHMHNRCHQRAAALVGLLREARDVLRLIELTKYGNDLLRRIDAATTDNAREG